jgi:hypothetical protein
MYKGSIWTDRLHRNAGLLDPAVPVHPVLPAISIRDADHPARRQG